jgi:hypothetical protein
MTFFNIFAADDIITVLVPVDSCHANPHFSSIKLPQCLSENTYSIAQAVGAPRVLRIAKGNSLKSIAESNSMFSKFNPSSVQT